MKTFTTLLLAAGVLAAAPAAAQVGGVAVADPQGAIANSRAWTAAGTGTTNANGSAGPT